MCGSQKKINFLKTKIACGFGTYPDTLRLNVTRKMLHVTYNSKKRISLTRENQKPAKIKFPSWGKTK